MKLLFLQDVSTAGADIVVPEELKKVDSIHSTVADSLKNLQITDLADVVTGKNTVVKDAFTGLFDLCVQFLPKLLGCILVLWIGFKLVKLLKKTMNKMFDKQNMEPSLRSFLLSFVDVLLKVLIIIMAMDIIGIKATSFIAIIGAAGLAVGMAMQGTLQNFAGGVIILIMKPFKVGDYISGGGHEGTVQEIKIFNTVMLTLDNKTIIVPNTDLATSSLINFSKQPTRRVDVNCGIAYGMSVDKARKVMLDLANGDARVLKDPAAVVVVTTLNDSSVDLQLRVWCKTEDYWGVMGYLTENVYKEFGNNGVDIPFPQMTVHMSKD